jgi:hypothetical protein
LSTNNKKILIFIDWFLPAFKAGGPIKSVSNIVNSLHHNFNFYIVTSDRDINEKNPFNNIQFNTWIKEGNYSIIYLTPEKRDNWIKSHLKGTCYDFYYFNSLFSKYFTLKPLLILNQIETAKKSIIVAPRGMLGEGALSAKSSRLSTKIIKKKLFLVLVKFFKYNRNITWHATNEEEEYNILNYFGEKSKIKIASNISICNIQKKKK